ncbi:hypothetical protein [Brumimicrobium sp.]|uniref:hypothetical protein n=1 Tax=Brumimicrobium sp. TaxID=2029867 RepID=UPI003A93D868
MKALKRILLAVSVLILLCIGGVFLVESYIEKQLKKEEQLSFGEFKMNFLGNVSLREVNFKNQKVEVSIEDVALDIGLINLIFSDTIIVKSSKAQGVRVNYYKLSSDSSEVSKKKRASRPFALKSIELSEMDIYSIEEKDTLISAKGVELSAELKDLENISFDQLLRVNLQSLHYKTKDIHDLNLMNLTYSNNILQLDTFSVLTRYSKTEYIHHIPQQKDHVSFFAHGIILDSVDFVLRNNELEKVLFNKINIDSLNLDVYRDKTIPQNTQHKLTYGQMVQQLNFEIDGEILETKNSKITYSMLGEDRKLSTMDFFDVNVQLFNIHNLPEKNKNAILKGTFCVSPGSMVGVDIAYNQLAKIETFIMDVHAKNIETNAVNSMLRPAVNVELSGKITELKSHMKSRGTAHGTFMVQSQNIELDVYNKKGKERKIVSFVASKLLDPPIKKNSEIKDFERDPTRSMWHYMWYFVLEGLKKTII